MERTRIFISYSHRDAHWLARLLDHLAVLERRGLVDAWSDTRIGVGSGWEAEIEGALDESAAAVLLISPSFLASRYIWLEEMPRIEAHQAQGMRVLPLIARPCPWRLEPILRSLQARPLNGRALSLTNEAEADQQIAAFVYELASTAGRYEYAWASDEIERTVEQPSVGDLYRQLPQTSSAPVDRVPVRVWLGQDRRPHAQEERAVQDRFLRGTSAPWSGSVANAGEHDFDALTRSVKFGPVLQSGQTLRGGMSIAAPTQPFEAVMQADGNFVVYQTDVRMALWASNTDAPGSWITMQQDGNLVLHAPDGAQLWASNTAGNPGASLVMQDDGNLVVYAAPQQQQRMADGTYAALLRPLWASNTQR